MEIHGCSLFMSYKPWLDSFRKNSHQKNCAVGGGVVDLKKSILLSSIAEKYGVKLNNIGGHRNTVICPFHADVNPSMQINDEKGLFHCFACGSSGDVITFVQKMENMSFPAALQHLQQLSGRSTDMPILSKKYYDNEDFSLINVLSEAAQFFTDFLKQNNQSEFVREYLKSRKIGQDTIDRFQLGFSALSPAYYFPVPPSPTGSTKSLSLKSSADENAMRLVFPTDSLLYHLSNKGYSLTNMNSAGLIRESIFNNSQDALQASYFHSKPMKRILETFRGRLVFPIFDNNNHVVAFGGRSMDQCSSSIMDQSLECNSNSSLQASSKRKRIIPVPKYNPKYLNSIESNIFKKKALLYGLHIAKPFIGKLGYGIIVEGYFDVLSLHEMGFPNAVGCLGTAISVDQVKSVAKYSKQKRIILLLDNDNAGESATMRVCEKMLESINLQNDSIDLRIVVLDRYLSMNNPNPGLSCSSNVTVIKDCSDLLVSCENSTVAADILKRKFAAAVDWKIWMIDREMDSLLNLVVSTQAPTQEIQLVSETQDRFSLTSSDDFNQQMLFEIPNSSGVQYRLCFSDVLILGKNMVQLLKRFPVSIDRTILTAYVAKRLAGGRDFIQKRLEFDILSSL